MNEEKSTFAVTLSICTLPFFLHSRNCQTAKYLRGSISDSNSRVTQHNLKVTYCFPVVKFNAMRSFTYFLSRLKHQGYQQVALFFIQCCRPHLFASLYYTSLHHALELKVSTHNSASFVSLGSGAITYSETTTVYVKFPCTSNEMTRSLFCLKCDVIHIKTRIRRFITVLKRARHRSLS